MKGRASSKQKNRQKKFKRKKIEDKITKWELAPVFAQAHKVHAVAHE